jgi:hypothetical protein
MPPKERGFSEVMPRRQREIVQTMSDLLQRHCPSDATLLLDKVFSKCEPFLPGLSRMTDACSQLVGSLGDLRAAVDEIFRRSRITVPSISVAEPDRAVCALDVSREQLETYGYHLGRPSYRSARNEPSGSARNRGGRPTKVSDATLQTLVAKVLEKYLQDSERIVVVGRGARRKMVLARHLSQKRFVIYKAEPDINNMMSSPTFNRMLKKHFPHVKPPKRLTDVCFWACASQSCRVRK